MNLNTGVSTRYLHMTSDLQVSYNDTVQQGDLLGYMSDTGIGSGVHLHFGVRFENSGASSVDELAKIVLDGRLLKGYQTECLDTDSDGDPDIWNRYYRSYNTAY